MYTSMFLIVFATAAVAVIVAVVVVFLSRWEGAGGCLFSCVLVCFAKRFSFIIP